MTVYDWQTQLAAGKAGEEAVLRWLRGQHPDWNIYDVRDNPFFQKLDTDFVAHDKGNTFSRYFEVKTDIRAHETGNLFLELEALRKSQADDWLIYVPQRQWLFQAKRIRLLELATIYYHAGLARQVYSQLPQGGRQTYAVNGVPIRMTALLTQVACTLYTQVGELNEQPQQGAGVGA